MAELPKSAFEGPLAPKTGLNDNYKSPLHDELSSSTNSGGSSNIKKLLPFGAIALALLILPLTIQQLNQSQDIRQRASQPTPTIDIPSPTPIPSNTPTPTVNGEDESIEATESAN